MEALKARLDQKCTKEYIRQWEDDRPIFRQKADDVDASMPSLNHLFAIGSKCGYGCLF